MTNYQKIDQLQQRCETTTKRTKAIFDRFKELGQDKNERCGNLMLLCAYRRATLISRITTLMIAQIKPINLSRAAFFQKIDS